MAKIKDYKELANDTYSTVNQLVESNNKTVATIGTIENTVANVAGQLPTKANQTQVSQIESDLQHLQTVVNTLDPEVKDIDTALAGKANVADVQTNTTNIATNTTAIATNKTNIATNTTNIATNKANIDDLKTTTTGLSTQVATNKTNIATNASDIATLSTKVDTKQDKLSLYDKTLKDISGKGLSAVGITNSTGSDVIGYTTINNFFKDSQQSNIILNNYDEDTHEITDETNETTVEGELNLNRKNLTYKANKDDLDTLSSQVATNTTNIANKQDKISFDDKSIIRTNATSSSPYYCIALTAKSSNTYKTLTDFTNLETQVATNTTNIANKQDKLTAGTNITITDNVISATGGGGGTDLTAGDNITIADGVISSDRTNLSYANMKPSTTPSKTGDIYINTKNGFNFYTSISEGNVLKWKDLGDLTLKSDFTNLETTVANKQDKLTTTITLTFDDGTTQDIKVG